MNSSKSEIKAYANMAVGSDVYPYEVIKIVSPKTVEVRAMDHKAVRLPKQFLAGGFSAHCVDNYNQEYSYSSNPEGRVMRIRLTKKGWRSGSIPFYMSDSPRYFYDYNF